MGSGISKSAEGECFAQAVASLLKIRAGTFDMARNVQIVHGLPIGTGGIVKDKRYWHAWVEFDWGDTPVQLVSDNTILQDGLTILRAKYYEVAQLTEEHVWRFDYEQVLEEIDTRQHWGPWVDGWEDLEEV